VDVALLERRFDRSPEVAFFVKDAAGRYVAVNESLVTNNCQHIMSAIITAWRIPRYPKWWIGRFRFALRTRKSLPGWIGQSSQ